MPTFRDFVMGLQALKIERSRPVMAHASLTAFVDVKGGAETLAAALLAAFDVVLMPAFTYKTMITPVTGPPDNAIRYGSGAESNALAEIFTPEMPADKLMGAVPEVLRMHPTAERSCHPILSFTGINAHEFLEVQVLTAPLAPIQKLHDAQGWVLLLGVDHTANTSLHFAEKLAGRRSFVRWALTPRGVRECVEFPGCSRGFRQVTGLVESITRKTQVGEGQIVALPLREMIAIVRHHLENNPMALLCERTDCERCNAVRQAAFSNPSQSASSQPL